MKKCSFGGTGRGWKGPHHCRRCAAWVERACREFARDVFFGIYDWQGFTPNERKAQAKRKAA